MRRSSGFTLIELVIVVVVLGVLAAIAIPRFIGLQREARIAVIDSMAISLRSGGTIVMAKSAVAGTQNLDTSAADIGAPGPTVWVDTNFGYPQAVLANLARLFDGLSPRFTASAGGTAANSTIILSLDGIATCSVAYTSPAVVGAAPTITRNITGC